MKRMSFTATGDSLILKHLPKGYEGFDDIHSYIMKAEARITNLETTLTDGRCYASSFSGGTWLTVKPDVLSDLKLLGFNLYGCANNHAMDYSYVGLESTIKNMEESGEVYAGIGRNLYEASRPGIIELPSARVGVIAATASIDKSARAGAQTPFMQGRPGVNMLRHNEMFYVTKDHMSVLKEIAKSTNMNGASELALKMGFGKEPAEGTFRFGSMTFVESEKEYRYSTANESDMERIEKEIKNALFTVDYVVVLIHSHEIKGSVNNEADYFLEEFARKCIDAGACAVVGGGTHELKGIEVYKGAPIFYSLGNFIFENEYVKVLPAEYCEEHNLPLDATASEGIMSRAKNAKEVMQNNVVNYRSVIPYFEMEGNRCVKLELLPISLGFGKEKNFANIPYAADEKETAAIYETLVTLSSVYGTKMEMKNGIIHINVDA